MKKEQCCDRTSVNSVLFECVCLSGVCMFPSFWAECSIISDCDWNSNGGFEHKL